MLCDYGRSYIDGHGEKLQAVFERVTRIKILNTAGFDEARAEMQLYYRESDQEKLPRLDFQLAGEQWLHQKYTNLRGRYRHILARESKQLIIQKKADG